MSKQLDNILGKATKATPEPEKETPLNEKSVEAYRQIQARVPENLARAINMKAAEEGTTRRVVILRALKDAGFEINDEELQDQRR